MSLVKGIHHVALKCCDEKEFEKTIGFYHDILGMPIVKSWNGGAMLHTGAGVMEILMNAEERLGMGTIRHFALATDDTDACIAAVRAAGYKVLIEPKYLEIQSDPVYPVRIAFCEGPLGEEVEFFQERE